MTAPTPPKMPSTTNDCTTGFTSSEARASPVLVPSQYDPFAEQVRKGLPDDGKGEPEHEGHDAQEGRERRVAAREDAIDRGGAPVLAAFHGMGDGVGTDSLDVAEAHVGKGGETVFARLFLHLPHDVLHGVGLVLVEAQGLHHERVVLDQLGGGEPCGKTGPLRRGRRRGASGRGYSGGERRRRRRRWGRGRCGRASPGSGRRSWRAPPARQCPRSWRRRWEPRERRARLRGRLHRRCRRWPAARPSCSGR